MMDQELQRSVAGSKIRLRSKSPYFTVLVGHLLLDDLPDDSFMPTASVNGRTLKINKKYWFSLTPSQREFLLAHEALHAAMGHCWRCGSKEPLRWNFAADYVVNLILTAAGFDMIPGGLLEEEYKAMTVEEVYALLNSAMLVIAMLGGTGRDIEAGRSFSEEEGRALENDWRAARAAARTAERMFGQGKDPLGHLIEVVIEDPSLQWQQHLWKALSFDHADFKNFDRRLIHDEMYVEDLEDDEGLAEVAVCIDTSGSTIHILGRFIGEVKSLASLYSVEIPIYFDDAALIGPIPLSEVEKPIGGGGTSFVPFFDEVKKMNYKHVVYVTDLMGTFPEQPPNAEVLWVVPAGTTQVPPFGKVAKLLAA